MLPSVETATARTTIPPTAVVAWQFISLGASNAVAVATLYWSQVIAAPVAQDFPDCAALVSLLPFATLLGYAAGVAATAFAPTVISRVPLRSHLLLLSTTLLACGLAPSLPWLILFSFAAGIGAACAQRLLASAAVLAGPDRAGAAIGATIAAALLGVLCVRLAGGGLAQWLGWRTVLIGAAGTVAVTVFAGRLPTERLSSPAAVIPLAVWRLPKLWHAALQQASLFAAYNAGWMTFLIELPTEQRSPVVVVGGAAGLLAATMSGRVVDRLRRLDVAAVGAAAVAGAACLLLPLAYGMPQDTARRVLLLAGMALLDAGLQAALVANQTRVQALVPGARSRLAALLTVCGAAGGGLGASAAYWSWHRYGWTAAVAVFATAAVIGLACSCPATWRRRAGLNDSEQEFCPLMT